MACRGKDRRQQDRIGARPRRDAEGAGGMGRRRDQPIRTQRFPMGGFPCTRFGKVQPGARDAPGECGIGRDQQKKPAFVRYLAQGLREFRARPGLGVAQDDGRAFGERACRGNGIRQPPRIGHQDEGRKARESRVESARGPC